MNFYLWLDMILKSSHNSDINAVNFGMHANKLSQLHGTMFCTYT